MNTEIPKRKCSQCNCIRLERDFGIRKYDIPYKTCQFCRGRGKKCDHNRVRSTCKNCKGSGICIHDRRRSQCRECKGGSICIHDRRKSQCKDCKGSSVCIHDRLRPTCKDCKGSNICIHDRLRFACIICNPKCACQYCHHVYVHSNYRFHPYCFRCYCILNPNEDIPRRYKLKEHHLRDVLKEKFANVNLIFDKRIDNGCSSRRPDVRIECLTHTVIVECDENQHKSYSCENKRTMEIFQDLGNRPLVIIRFNPDSYVDERGNKRASCFSLTKANTLTINKGEWRGRIKALVEIVEKHIKNIPGKEVIEECLYYNQL